MKSMSIYMALIILFSINFRSVCVGGDKDKQSSGRGTTQEYGNKEKKLQSKKKIQKTYKNLKREQGIEILNI